MFVGCGILLASLQKLLMVLETKHIINPFPYTGLNAYTAIAQYMHEEKYKFCTGRNVRLY
jgi:hypothetical protein